MPWEMFNTIPVVLPQFSEISIHQVSDFHMTHDPHEVQQMKPGWLLFGGILSGFCLKIASCFWLYLYLELTSISGDKIKNAQKRSLFTPGSNQGVKLGLLSMVQLALAIK